MDICPNSLTNAAPNSDSLLEIGTSVPPYYLYKTPSLEYAQIINNRSGIMGNQTFSPTTTNPKEYQLSYGMDASTSTMSDILNSQRKQNHYGLMEDSYYEDGLNGNNLTIATENEFVIRSSQIPNPKKLALNNLQRKSN